MVSAGDYVYYFKVLILLQFRAFEYVFMFSKKELVLFTYDFFNSIAQNNFPFDSTSM